VPKRDSPLLGLLQAALLVVGIVQAIRSPSPRPAGPDAESVAVGQERSDMRPGVVLGGLILLAVTLGLVLFLVNLLGGSLSGVSVSASRPAPLSDALTPGPTPPAPRLEAESGSELAAYRAATDQQLHSYRWVDRSNGVVAIPIDRAMHEVAQQGLPARPSPTAVDRGSSVPSRASSGRVLEERTP
jgi:hypothetical protein